MSDTGTKKSQQQRILDYFLEHPNEWINGQYFLRTMYFSQFHHKIWVLQHERGKYLYGGVIEASDFRDEHGFKSYRLKVENNVPANA